ncbi:flavodoxin family protein [Pyrococcus kukulkanii]|uniref:Flavodoxin domain-containing protein n=1 Tax=Pyrococcus kukulkanii TaxID=1609559 RepID=A0ABV4T437_9EURY
MIVYSTRRGSTKKIAEAIAEGLGDEAFNLREEWPEELEDFIVLGTPIYYERPLPEVLEFIRRNDGLEGKVIAVFVVCMADLFGVLGKRYAEFRYLNLVKREIKGDVIDERIFRGWIRKENSRTIKEAYSWGLELAEIFGGKHLMPTLHVEDSQGEEEDTRAKIKW